MLWAQMPGLDPSKHRILLVGPRVIHLKPFFERRRYSVVAVQRGVEGMSALDAERRDIVILELNLGDLTATEFLMAARQAHADSSFLLLDDASKAGQIVKALQAGLDGYLPTPPDEDRLFFEVERHLRRSGSGAGPDNNAGTQTTVSPRPSELKELTELQTQLADRESQIVEFGMQSDLLNQEIVKLRAEAKKLNAVRSALIGQIEGDLDEEQAFRLKDRLAMASVLETEADTLREELGDARNIRRELQGEIEALKKRLQDLGNVGADVPSETSAGDRAEAFEADNMVLAGRIAELEEELDLTKAEVVALEQKQLAETADLERQLNRLSSDQALRANDDDKVAMEHMAAIARLENEHRALLASQREDHDNAMGQLKEEHEAALKRAHSDVEIEKASARERIAEAVVVALRDKEREHREHLGGKEKQLQAKLDAALGQIDGLTSERDAASAEKDSAVEKALDIELILDELKTKIDYLEGEVETQKRRATKAETDFKKDKLRLIEEKEEVTAGSQQVFERMQRFVDENAVLRKANSELEMSRAGLEQRATEGGELAARAEGMLAQASVIRAEAIQQRDAAESALRASEERLQTLERQLLERIAATKAQGEEERRRREAAERGLADAGEAANRLADARASINSLEAETARLQRRIDDAEETTRDALGRLDGAQRQQEAVAAQSCAELERTMANARAEHEAELGQKIAELEDARSEQARVLAQARSDVEAAANHQGGADALVGELRARIASLEDAALERDARAREARDAMADSDRQRAEIVERYEARLSDALSGGSATSAEMAAERDAYRARLAETEAWVQQAQLHLEALRVERDQLAAQATALANDGQARSAETQELYLQLAAANQQVEALTARSAHLEHEVTIAQAAPRAAVASGGTTALTGLQDEVTSLRAQLQQMQQQAQRSATPSAGKLPEELEPLRWTLTAAIDALTSLEQREPALAAHLRNLRLLASTLQKLG